MSKEQNWKEITSAISKYEDKEGKDLSLENKNIDKVKYIMRDHELNSLMNKINNPETSESFNYANLVDLHDKVKSIYDNISIAKEEIDINEFFKRGEVVNFKKLQVQFKKQKLHKKFPNFNFDRFVELVKSPMTEIPNFQGEVIHYDRFLARKIMIGFTQMIFSEMDFYMINVGKEGSGKSCFASQVLLYLYTILKEVELVECAYDVRKLFFSSLKSVLEVQESQKDNDYFRIMVLDEAYELNRQNFREEASREFKDDMRSSRKMLRVVILNLPQIGELETAITLTRCNFIFFSDMDSDAETGTVKKGEIYMYIIPRGKRIYSPFQRRNISDEEIINSIAKVLKDKNDSYKGFPKNCLIHKFKVKGIWGFDKEEYDKHIKKENKKRRMSKDIKATDYIGYILYDKLPALKNWGTFDLKKRNDKKMYGTIQKWIKKDIKNRYIMNPELRQRYELLYGSD